MSSNNEKGKYEEYPETNSLAQGRQLQSHLLSSSLDEGETNYLNAANIIRRTNFVNSLIRHQQIPGNIISCTLS